jgi:peptide/nickel transport system ATP-binding protein
VSSPLAPPRGCAFAPRCAMRSDECDIAMPRLEAAGNARQVRCIRVREEVVA